MNMLLAEWISKAEGDYAVARREMEASGGNCDAICFHSQQMAEKYLKAFLFKNRVDFPKVHNLVELLELCLVNDSSLETCRDFLDRLEDYAVLYRYPGASADQSDADIAFRDAGKIRTIMRSKLDIND
ncbi:MAG: HEPN domain-containing protein [Chloroflexi bacterium]|nr:HEPN domain-containing protein [Chloroflexota bacterium]